MAIRTTRKQVTFHAPFRLAEVAEQLPAGTYDVDVDEEVIEGNQRNTYVRVATLIYLEQPGSTRTVTIDPAGLQAALERDPDTGGVDPTL